MTAPEKTYLSSPKLKLTAVNKRGEEKGYAKLGWEFSYNKLQLTFYSGFKDSKNVYLDVGYDGLMMICDCLLKAATSEKFTGTRFTVTKGFGQKREEQGSIVIGRSEDGVIWMSLDAEGCPKLRFELLYPSNLSISNLDGSEKSKAELSSLRATGYAKALVFLGASVAADKFDPNAGANFNKGKSGGGSSGGSSGHDYSNDSDYEY